MADDPRCGSSLSREFKLKQAACSSFCFPNFYFLLYSKSLPFPCGEVFLLLLQCVRSSVAVFLLLS